MIERKIAQKIVDLALQKGWIPTIKQARKGDEPWESVEFDPDRHTDLIVGTLMRDPNTIIFDHRFAKKFWPEKHDHPDGHRRLDCKVCGDSQSDYEWDYINETCWKANLMMMALEEEPIEYIFKFIENGE